ncbi:MAG: hypothetical protein ACI33M_06540 [Lysinibacillus sp.]
MRRFVSLVKKEWHEYKLWAFLMLFAGVFFIGILPTFAYRLPNWRLAPDDVRLAILFMAFGGLCFIANIQFVVSLRKDIKIKEIWLHNSSNILTLIGAKVCFSVCWGTVISIIYGVASYFLGDALYGELYQLIFFHLMIVMLSFYTIILLTITALVFYTIYLQLKRYIGMASIVVTGLLFFLSIYGFEKVASSVIYKKLLYVGDVSLALLGKFFPIMFNDPAPLVGHLYIFEEIFLAMLLVACFIVASKWIERVITR